MRIQTKLQFFFISTSIILGLSILSVTYVSMVNHFEQLELNRLKSSVLHKSKTIDDFMFARVADFNVFSNNPLFSKSSNTISSQYLTRVVNQYPFYENLSFVDKNGIVLSSSNQKFIGINILQLEPDIEDEFNKTLNGGNNEVFISSLSEFSQKEIEEGATIDIELLSDVIDLNQNVIGVLVGFIKIQNLTELIFDRASKRFENEYTYLLDNKGTVLISDNQKIELLQAYPEFLKTDLQQKSESKNNGFFIYKSLKGIKTISGYASLSKYETEGIGNWLLVTTVPYTEIMKPVYQIVYKAFFIFLFIMLIFIALNFMFSRSLSKPIVMLEQAVYDFKINRKPINLKNSNKDEIGILSRSFNIMTNNIYSLYITEDKLTKEKEKKEKELFYAKSKITFQKKSLKKEKELSELKTKFASTASHEFRTPLSAINLTAGSIKKYWSKMEPNIIEKKLEKIEDQVLHMTNLLDDMLILGQADADKIRNNPLHLNLGDFISEIIEDVSISCEKSHEILLIDTEELKNSDIYIDKKVGRNIFINLLTNAIKFSPEADKITVELSSEKDNILFKVTDYGIGISKSELKNVFKAFVRGKNVDLIQGTGLGLTIVKNAITVIGGEIIVKSTVGKGTSFIVKIPKK